MRRRRRRSDGVKIARSKRWSIGGSGRQGGCDEEEKREEHDK